MGEGGAARVAAAELLLGQVDPVRQHRAPSDQSVVIVDVEVVPALGKQRGGPFDLALVLGDVRLHQDGRDARARARRRLRAARASRCRAKRGVIAVEACARAHASVRSAPCESS